jgi:DNA polymerase III subunit chi
MADVWFYELTDEPAEAVLPGLLAKHQQRGDRVSVVCLSKAKADELSARIWAIEDVSFVTHGVEGDTTPAQHPIWISTSIENQNVATFRYLIEGAMPGEVGNFARVSILFESEDDQKSKARETWKRMKAEGHAVKYWKKSDEGRWVDQAA